MDNNPVVVAYAVQSVWTHLRLALDGLDALGLELPAIHAETALNSFLEANGVLDHLRARIGDPEHTVSILDEISETMLTDSHQPDSNP